MKKVLKIFTMILFMIKTPLLYANNYVSSLCEDDAYTFGNGKGQDKINSACLMLYKTKALKAAQKKSPDGQYKVTGHKNIIFIEKASQINVLAGSHTELKSVKAVAIDTINNEIAVLEESGDVLFFSLIITGNVAPLRIIKSKELYGAHDLLINHITDELIVLNKLNNNIIFLSRMANYLRREEKRNLSLLRSIEGVPSKVDSISLNEKFDELYGLDKNNKKVSTFKLSKE